jgi:glutamyl-tRNA synthetase
MSGPGYCGRFAPSPTGQLHLGTARTALLAFKRARAAGGRFLIRIEDLDSPRVVAGSAQSMLKDLAWLGIDWDDEPLVQSRNLARYEAALQTLKDAGKIYPCSCTRKEIALSASAPHGEDGPPYGGLCREKPQDPGRPLSWRFRVEGEYGDFVVRRADGVFAYQLACAVDDAESGVTEVVRGEDLRSSAARQAAIIRALGHEAPAYLHAPLLTGPDGSRLSKRLGSVAISELRAAGMGLREILGMMGPDLDAIELT